MIRRPHSPSPRLVLTIAALSAGLSLAGCSGANEPATGRPGVVAAIAPSTEPSIESEPIATSTSLLVTTTTRPVTTTTRPVAMTATNSAPGADLDQSLAAIDRALAETDHQLTDADHDVATPEGDIR